MWYIVTRHQMAQVAIEANTEAEAEQTAFEEDKFVNHHETYEVDEAEDDEIP